MQRRDETESPLGLGLLSLLLSGTALAQKYDGSSSPNFIPHTLQEALSTAYLTNPTLREERAHLRATDEQLPRLSQAGAPRSRPA